MAHRAGRITPGPRLFFVKGVSLRAFFQVGRPAHLNGMGILLNMTDLNSLPLINDKSSRQFELEVEGRMAKLEYELNGTKMFLTHASVPKALSGTGVGNALVEKVFAYIEENNLKLVPMCSFVTAHLRKHPEWKRIVEKGVEI